MDRAPSIETQPPGADTNDGSGSGAPVAPHTFASLAIASNVNAKALSIYMGHATLAFTLDRYGHLMPGNETEAADLLDAYLSGADAG
jgi:integrase